MIWQDGVTEGEARGIMRGKAEGKAEGKADAYIEMIREGFNTEKEAAKRLNISEEEMKALLEREVFV